MKSARNMLRAAAGGSSGGGGGGGGSTILNATFTGPDSTSVVPNADTGQVWHTDSGTWGISSNKLYASSTPSDNHGYYDAGIADNCTITATLAVMAASSGLCFRYQDENNHFVLNVGGGNAWTVYRRQAGGYTQINTASPAIAASGDTIKVVLAGTSITVTINGTTNIPVTAQSAFLTATKVGFRALSTSARWDNLTVQ